MRYKTTTSTNLLFDYYNMIDSFKHRLSVHGNIENTLWSSEPFSWWQNMGVLALGDFSQKGFYARCCDAGIGWQSNLGLFFLIWLALELARGEGGCCPWYNSSTEEMFSNVTQTTNMDQSSWGSLYWHFGHKIVYHLLNAWYLYIIYVAEDLLLDNSRLRKLSLIFFKIKNRWGKLFINRLFVFVR